MISKSSPGKNKLRNRLMVLVLLSSIVAALMWSIDRPARPVATLENPPPAVSFVHMFNSPMTDEDWYVTDFSFESEFYRTGFLAENVQIKKDRTELVLDRRDTDIHPNSGAEIQRNGDFSFGRYEVVMRPAKGSGVVSSFFTHTFDLFGDPHDEIDFEFLGNNTRMVSVNSFTNGKAFGPKQIKLPFDAAQHKHLYAFEWLPDRIDWYVDDQRVHTITSEDYPIPQAPGRLMMSIWTGSPEQYGWHGKPTFKNGVAASYYCTSFQAAGDTTPQCSDTFRASKRKPSAK